MAKAKLNPILTSMHGRIGNMVFYRRRNREYIRMHVIPRNPDTESQRIVRRTFADAVKSWQAMTKDERYKFNRKARNLCKSGYNVYISEYIKARISAMSKPDLKSGHSNELYSSGIQRTITSVSPPFITVFRKNMPSIPFQYNPG